MACGYRADQLTETWKKTNLGPSYSGPVVTADKVFTTETEGKKREVIRAFDRATGEQLWEARWDGAMKVPLFARANGSWIRSTPTVDGNRLFVGGIRDVLVCLNTEDGSELWRIDFVDKFKTKVPTFGFVCSPMVVGEHLYIQAGEGLAKIEKATGKLVWRTLKDGGGMMGSAFSSPVMVELQGKEQVVVQTRQRLAGVDPENGEELWSQEIPAFRGMNILTPTINGNTVFTSTYGGKTWLFDVVESGGKFSLEEKWSTKTEGYMSSPVVIDGHAYVHLKNQRFTCIELATGERKWITKPYGKYWSLVANGDRILALDETGDLLLIRATPDGFNLVEQRHISDDSTWAHLAVAGSDVFVRQLNGLVAYRWK